MHTAPLNSTSSNRAWIGWSVIVVALTGLMIWSWRRWPDLVIDFGPQLYVPWRLTQGAVLYRDIMYLPGGPLSQYWNVLLFKIFGASVLTLSLANLAVTIGIVCLIYRRFLAVADTLTATTIVLALLVVFAFGQYEPVANYTYLNPYCHEILHGLALSVLAVCWMSDWLTKRRVRFALGAGLCFGLTFLTKPEIFLALTMVVFAAAFLCVPKVDYFSVKSMGVFLISAFVPLLAFLFYFHQHEHWSDSWRAVTNGFGAVLASHISADPYYRWCLGLDTPGLHLWKMTVQFFALSAIVLFYALLFRLKTDVAWKRMLLIALTVALLAASSAFAWLDSGRCLPLLSLALLLVLGLKWWLGPTDNVLVFPMLWSVFGLAMLAKLGFYSRIWHYGFVLAMPAFVAGIYFLLWVLPGILERFGVQRCFFRGALWLALLFGVLQLFLKSDVNYRNKSTVIGGGANRIMVNGSDSAAGMSPGVGVGQACEWVEKNIPHDATLAVLPEGAMVNFLTQRINSTHYHGWSPPELAAFGQAVMTEDFRQHRPDYVMLIQRDPLEYRLKYFGQQEQYGRELMSWIHQNYEVVHQIGQEPFKTGLFGIQILRLKPGAGKP